MNTLQKLSEIEQKLSMFEKMAIGMPKLIQDFSRLSDDVKQMNQAIKNVVDGVNKRTGDLSQMDNLIITRQMTLEQSLASLSKTCAAMVAELSETKVLDQDSVLARLRKSDEEAEKARVEKLIEQKVLTASEAIAKSSLLVVSQTFTDTKGAVDVVTEYRVVDLSSPDIDEETRKNYIGKQGKDVVELNLKDGVLKTTILQVYDYVQVYAKSDGEAKEGAVEGSEATTQQ